MKRKLLFAAILIASALGSNLFAQFDADKTYVISNRNDANVFMQDNGTGIVAAGSLNGNSYWIFEAAENADCYYVKNAVTEKYMQSTKTSGESVATGTTPVEICVKLCSVEGDGMYGFASTDQSTYDFTSGTIGANWDNSRVQGYAAVAGTNHKSFWKVVEQAMPDPEPTVPTDWSAPQAPGVDLSTLSESTDVFVYNIEADAIFSRGFNWLTMALADRPEGGDYAVPANRQKVQIRKDGGNIKIHWNDRDADAFFGQANNTDPGQMWTDLKNAGNRVVFTPAASANYPNAYTLTNVQHSLKVDVLWGRGGKLTLWDGQGFYDWAFLTGDAFTSGKLAQFKVRKAMWNLYQALDKVNAVSSHTDALNTALAVYTNASASTDELRAAFRAMFLAVAGSIEDPVDVSYIFNHPDMSGDKTAAGWSYSDFAFSAGECEKYHATFESTQSITDAPGGLYDVVVTGIYRQDDGQSQDAPQLVVSNGTSEWTANFPNMDQLGGKWNIGGDPTNDWVNSSTGKMPNWMWSASDAQTHDDAAAIIESVKVKEHTLNVTFKVTGGNQWFNFQRLFVTYKGSINGALYKSLQAKITEAGDYITANTGVIPPSFLTAINTAVSSAEGLTANSDEQDLTDALNAINNALTPAKSAPTIANLNLLQATVTLAAADGVNTTEAQALIDNPTTATAVNDALSALRLARRVANAETQTDVFAGNAPAAGDYYLYNVGTGRFFCGGDDWGAHAALGFPGIIVTLESDGDNFHMNTHLPNGNSVEYLTYNGYCDTAKGDTWSFVEVSTGVYNIARSNNSAQLLGYSTNTYNRLDTDKSGADNPDNQWKLVTKADRDALLATATEQAPQDASYLIKSPNFSQREDVSAWTFTNASIWGRGGNHPDFAIEAYNQTSATVEQTVTGLPAGTYELKVQAFYRDGNFETQVNTLSNGGDARQLATLYAGTKSALIQNVSGGADKAPGMGRASTIGYMPDGIDDACLYFQSGLYWATLDEIVVGQDGTMTIGARKTEKLNDGDWMVLDNFRLIYKGSGIDLSGVKADLLAKIGDATDLLDNLDLNLSFLATAVSTGQNVYDNSSDADEIVDATNALQTAINQTNAATDMTVFKQTMAKAQPEGVAVNVFKNAVEAVTEGSTFAATVSEQLYLLRSDRKVNALRMPDIYTGSAPAAGKVYLFNVGTGMFLGVGSDWETHAAVDQVGIEVELVASGNGFIMKSAWGSFNNSPYVDTGANTVYTFQAVDGKDGVYNILEGSDLLGWNPNGKTDGKKYWNSISNVTGADANDANYQWKVITPAERKALLATAANDHPVDVSYLINNPSHNRKAGNNYDMYTKVAPGGNGGARVSSVDDNNGDRAADFGYEFWNVDNLEWSQQLTGLTPGTYEVAVQGYYREGDGGYQAGVVNNGGTLLRKAYLKANDETAKLQNIAYCLDGVPGVGTAVSNNGTFPNWPREAFEYFETGYYWTSVQVTVGNDGLLKIGVYKDSKTDNDWIVLDNFRLRLLSAATASATVKITDAKYATFIAPFDVEIPDGVTASTAEINENGTKLDLTDLVGTIPAHTAVILFSENTLTKEVSGVRVADPENLTTDALTGTYEDVQAPEGSYVLQNQAEGVGFYQVAYAEAKPWVRANRAYLTAPNNNVKAFILGESDADGIRSLENGFQGTHNGEIFNLAGQRMTKTQRGVNIVNKKKVVIK